MPIKDVFDETEASQKKRNKKGKSNAYSNHYDVKGLPRFLLQPTQML
jgi:hypothetical protein